MSIDDRLYRLGAIEEDGQHVEDDDDRTELKKDDDSPLCCTLPCTLILSNKLIGSYTLCFALVLEGFNDGI
jgi:hypothetical protein